MSHLVAPSILAADFSNLRAACDLINNSEADWYHIDVMDGMYVPNISFGMPVISAIKKHAKKPFDVHLMIEQPDRYVEDFKKAGADVLTVHYEACTHLHRTIQLIKSHGMKAGVALNPHTSEELLKNVIGDLDLVLVMSVNPGFGGQKFIEKAYDKISNLRKMIDEAGSDCLIEVDGGVTDQNYRQLVEAGANVLVAGSYVFKANDPAGAISGLKKV